MAQNMTSVLLIMSISELFNLNMSATLYLKTIQLALFRTEGVFQLFVETMHCII